MEIDILDSIEGLSYAENEWRKPEEIVAASKKGIDSQELLKCIVWLANELKVLGEMEESLNAFENAESFFIELGSFLREMNCPIKSLTDGPCNARFNDPKSWLCLLNYLTSELQAARMLLDDRLAEKESMEEQAVTTTTESETAGDLRRMLMGLDFPKPPDDITPQQLFAKTSATIKERLGNNSDAIIGRPLLTALLSEQQWQSVDKLRNDMKAEYAMRIDMLLKRLDVTIQSFTWSQRIKKFEEELAKVYQPRRRMLSQETTIQIADILAARNDLTIIEKTSSHNVRKHTASKINKVLMKGRMPDRGGRPTEIQAPPPEMPSWQKERAPAQPRGGGFGGGGGGRGGGFGGGRGGGGGRGDHRGGGGGRVQGGWSGGRGGGRGGGGGGFQPQHPHQPQNFQQNHQSQALYGGHAQTYQPGSFQYQHQDPSYGGYNQQGGGGYNQQSGGDGYGNRGRGGGRRY